MHSCARGHAHSLGWRDARCETIQYESSTQRTQPHTTSQWRGDQSTTGRGCTTIGQQKLSHSSAVATFHSNLGRQHFPRHRHSNNRSCICGHAANTATCARSGRRAACFLTDFWFWFLPFLCWFFVFLCSSSTSVAAATLRAAIVVPPTSTWQCHQWHQTAAHGGTSHQFRLTQSAAFTAK